MRLKELASLLTLSRIDGDGMTEIAGIQTDSRKVRPGDLFICLPGHTVDGHRFAGQAAEQGAAALVVQREVDANLPKIVVNDTRYAMAVIANHFYGYPSHEMKVIGVTGTNGKTTTTYLIEKILRDYGRTTGLLGTISVKIGAETYAAERTTMEALDLQRTFRRMRDADTEYCVMEVSSHALEQGRVKGCNFRTAVFTNLTQDHLDYHQTMEKYKQAKGLLFSRLGNTFSPDPGDRKFAVLNADDPVSREYGHLTSAQVITYGIENEADVRASDIRITPGGTQFKVASFAGTAELRLKLLGKFNVYNALAAIASGLAEGIPLQAIKHSLEQVEGVAGRMETIDEGQDFLVIVDYAHSPDGLENALATIREFAKGKVICVFGCGGDRDRTKRPVMGRIAAEYSDYVLVTSDNPRSEDPEAIMKEIESGILPVAGAEDRYRLVADRRAAIQMSVEMASSNDVVLIAGKGHEPGQTIKGITYEFDDRLVAKEAIRSLLNG